MEESVSTMPVARARCSCSVEPGCSLLGVPLLTLRTLPSLSSTNELTYPTGISLLTLKNHLLLSYLHNLLATFHLKLTSQSLTSAEGAEVVANLVKLRVVLEKVAPLEGKLKYQIEKLVRRADQAAEGADEEDVANGAPSLLPSFSGRH